ncbi:L-aspartate oxidase [Flavobacterium sp. TSSA_36]|uniref:L-aspartate oxidase n=1 Tax=Flavobacterium sp. TSSA_36 TaxID=3447669 RepID=UPI003F37E7BD
MIQTHYLIIGSGVAGLTFALKMATRFPEKKITIITKANAEESNTKYAQGGIAIVTNKLDDSYEKHIQDTLICGDGLCDEKVVHKVITEGPKRLQELINWGAQFDKNGSGNFDLGKEGGHSQNRVVHHKDQTGFEIERAILKQVYLKENITVLPHHFAIDLIVENNNCLGVQVLNQNDKTIFTCLADYTLLASGGIGNVYGHTTNPIIATGDGIAMAYRVQAEIKEMEFIQFHPTALFHNVLGTQFLISEAVRGFGAYLKTKKGYRFMADYDERMELASRDIISQSIDFELKKSGESCVYLDCTHLDLTKFKAHFPMIYEHCLSIGIDIAQDWIPVVPAQHYLCGGIIVDLNGKTSVNRLFACGECSRTGLHGANRLASNSLLEALVFSNAIYDYLSDATDEPSTLAKQTSEVVLQKNRLPLITNSMLSQIKSELQLLMRSNAGIVRNNHDLKKAKHQLNNWLEELVALESNYQGNTAFYELKNMITVGILIVQHSLLREENRGGFFKISKASL